MQKISSISFKGIEQKHAPENNANVSNPIGKELGVQVLPIGDKSLAINPSLPSDFLNEGDIARYKKVQTEWAERLAKQLNLSTESIMARLPEITLGDAKTMMATNRLGCFYPHLNIIEINPIREMANSGGGDDVKIVHESTHGLFHNLRRAWAKQLESEPEQIEREAGSIVQKNMRLGEDGLIIQEVRPKTIDGKQILIPTDVMVAPILSKEERMALSSTINALKLEYLDTSTGKLNNAGRAFVRETLLPQLTTYAQQIANSENKEDKICEKMTDYINAAYARTYLLIDNLIEPSMTDLERNLQTPLTEVEKNMAKNSLHGLLSTQEGNYIQQFDRSGVLDNSAKSYFMSYEEVIARKEETTFRLAIVKQKIADITAKGLQPSETLIREQQIAEHNLDLLSLVKKLGEIEKHIVGAEKNPDKVAKLNQVKQQVNEIMSSIDVDKYDSYIADSEFVESEEDVFRLIKERIPPELQNGYQEYVDAKKRLNSLIEDFNLMSAPENLLAETQENMGLKSQFETIMQKIKKLVPECDLIGIPKQFFSSEQDFLRVNGKAIECMQKWARRIL